MMSFSEEPNRALSFLFKIGVCCAFVLLVTRLAELQIVKGSYYRDLSDNNRIRSVPISAPRGRILARGGEVLADNKEQKKVVIFDPASGYKKVPAEGELSQEETISEWNRIYPAGSPFAHVVGYLGQVDEKEVLKSDPHCIEKGIYESTSFIGRSGLEEQYNCALRGIDGDELVEVDIQGKKIRSLGMKSPQSGADLHTTIDYGLQKALATSFKDLKGAAVATDTKGQILAMYSNPSFDPSVFLTQNPTNQALVRDLFADASLPLFNRAISGAYHPGSIFKIIVGAGALEEGIISQDFTYRDTGAISINGFNYTTWYYTQYGGVEGELTLTRALARSTDTFFYKVGEMMGIDHLVNWANSFGIGKKTNVDLPGEIAGILPSPAWKQKVLNERWFLGNTYHFSIGQGDLLTTPLQGNMVTTAMANGGSLCRPTLTFQKTPNCQKLPVSQQTRDILYTGMKQACETGGTAFPFFDFEPRVACKTGTAETGEDSPTHAWFTVSAPADNPEIILTVLVEKGGEGSKVAAPIAREVLDYWFHIRTP